MCGFVVVLATAPSSWDTAMLGRMTELLAHRGPDDRATFTENAVGIGFRRLAVFDLADSGRQPMMSADGRHVIVFNGAIFNYIELRSQLQSLGHVFRSTGDTEVLLAAYRQWGAACLEKLNGMWSFVIYDRTERRLFGSRDRFGIKPLYVYRDAQRLILTSEIKAIRDSGCVQLAPDWRTATRFLLEDCIEDSSSTFYAGVQAIPAGNSFEVDGSGNIQQRRYWSLMEAANSMAAPADPVAQYGELFEDAIGLRMRSDVPVGVLLSGGLDSTSIICAMARERAGVRPAGEGLNALCYHDAQFSETELIAATLQQTGAQMSRMECEPTTLWDNLAEHLWYHDEPVNGPNSLIVFELMKTARAHGLKVMLNGQGADEVLAGYGSYFHDYWSELAGAGRWRAAHRGIMEYVRGHGGSAMALHKRILIEWLARMRRRLPGFDAAAQRRRTGRIKAGAWVSQDVMRSWEPAEERRTRTLSEALQWSVERAYLPLYLRVEDRNSMAHGVEVRLPFLDHRLVAMTFRLDSEWKLRGQYTKVILRQAMQSRIPESVRTRVKKYGFPTSIDSWFRGKLYAPMRDLLASRGLRESGVWDVPAIERALEQHRRGEVAVGARLFDVAQFNSWMNLSRGVPGA